MISARDYHCRATVQGHAPGVTLSRTVIARSAIDAITVMRTWMLSEGYRASAVHAEAVENPGDSAYVTWP